MKSQSITNQQDMYFSSSYKYTKQMNYYESKDIEEDC